MNDTLKSFFKVYINKCLTREGKEIFKSLVKKHKHGHGLTITFYVFERKFII